jgi:hypothetical protein
MIAAPKIIDPNTARRRNFHDGFLDGFKFGVQTHDLCLYPTDPVTKSVNFCVQFTQRLPTVTGGAFVNVTLKGFDDEIFAYSGEGRDKSGEESQHHSGITDNFDPVRRFIHDVSPAQVPCFSYSLAALGYLICLMVHGNLWRTRAAARRRMTGLSIDMG